MKNMTVLIAAIVFCVMMNGGCKSKPEETVLSAAAPQAAFYGLCDAFQRDDYDAAYETFSAKMKKALSEMPQGAISNADDLKKAYAQRGDEVKKMANGASVSVSFMFENYAQGTIIWSDGSTQMVWFAKEDGVWKIDLGVEEGAESVGPREGTPQPNTPKPQP
jgi:hypothetical protein